MKADDDIETCHNNHDAFLARMGLAGEDAAMKLTAAHEMRIKKMLP